MIALDTHVHVWDPRVLDYPWLEGSDRLDHPFLPEDYRARGAHRVVFVEADCRPDQALDEARWVAQLDWPELVGIVAAADLRSPTLLDHLDAVGEIGRVVGIRHLLQGEAAEGFADPALRRGLAAVAERGLAFDACTGHAQLPALAALLRAIPSLRVVVDHVGKPPVEAGVTSVVGRQWAGDMRLLAELPGVHVKLSGLPAESEDAAAFAAHADDFLRVAVEAFGPQRAMLASDWPVSARLGAAVETDAWTTRVRNALALGASEWDWVAGAAGDRFYRLDGG
jgi:L-fuconolactonase